MKPRIFWSPEWRFWVCADWPIKWQSARGRGETPKQAYDKWLVAREARMAAQTRYQL